MGLWHHRVINRQKTHSRVEKTDLHFRVSETIELDKGGELALLFAPYASSALHPHHLHSKDKVFLAIDGQISNLGNASKVSDNTSDYIINLYQTYGSEGLYQLDGAFSLILYDAQKQTTLLYRSFLTGYPLYFVTKNNLLSVSTNPVYLLHRSDVSDTLDTDEMNSIFAISSTRLKGNVFSELTAVKHGEMVIITPNKIQHKKRPLNEIFVQEHYGSESEAIEKYRHLVEKAVHESLLPDAEHGIMLSSGMDSSTLAVFASKKLYQEGREFTAYSWTLPNDALGDESEKIKELCKMLGIPLKLFNGESYGPFDDLDNLLLLPDTPFTNPFIPITAEVYRRASRDGIDVLLNGNYADVTFQSNRNLLVDIIKDKRYELIFPSIMSIVKRDGYRNVLKKSQEIRGLLAHYMPRRIKASFQIREWLSDDVKSHREKMLLQNNKFIEQEGFGCFSTALSSFQAGYLGMDRYLSGQYGIRRIEPHRHLELLNYSLGFPSYMTHRDGQTKYFAREAMRGLLPESIRTQPRAGNLDLFVQNSYARNKTKIREMLLDDRSVWKQYVNETWMENKLKSNTTLSYADFFVIWLSLNMQQWQKAIKPGGSLYEGHFTYNINAK